MAKSNGGFYTFEFCTCLVYCNTDFGRFRMHYLVNDFENVVEDNVLAANVLLSFEIARREIIPESYPLRRFEVKETIERVISLWVDDEYDEKVNWSTESCTA